MSPVEAIGGAITGIKTAIGMAAGLKAIDDKLKLAELNNKLADVLNALTDSMMDVSKLTIENMELKEKLKKSEAVDDMGATHLCPDCKIQCGDVSVIPSPQRLGAKMFHNK